MCDCDGVFDRLMRSQFFEPDLEIMVKSSFIVVYENQGSDVHSVHKTNALHWIPLFRTSSATVPVILAKPRRFATSNHKCSVNDFIR